jgi:amidohydrolase
MIRDGALKNPRVDGILSLHLRPDYPEGMVVVKPAHTTTSSAGFVLRMIGKGGHVAFPHQTVDPIVMAGMVIMAAQTILSRRVDPLEPTIVAFGSVQGGTANNVIPDEVTLTGTIRTLKPEARQDLARLLEETAQGVAQTSGGEYRLEVEMEYPAVFNHPGMVKTFKKSAVKIAGPDRVREARHPMMGGEDVAYFHQQVPGVQWYLGAANPAKGFTHGLHNARFDFNEEVMPLGAAIHAQSALDFLSDPLVS